LSRQICITPVFRASSPSHAYALLKTKVKRVAEERLPAKLRELRDQPAAANTVASLVEEYKRKIAADADLEVGSVEYKEYCIDQIGKCWPGFQQLRIPQVPPRGLVA
jgi:hypothetical protein